MRDKKITLKQRVLAIPKGKIFNAFLVIAIVAIVIGLVAVLLNAKIGLNTEIFK